MPPALHPLPQAVLLELFGHSPQPSGLLEPWGGRSLVELLERGQLSSRQFYEEVVGASGERAWEPACLSACLSPPGGFAGGIGRRIVCTAEPVGVL